MLFLYNPFSLSFSVGIELKTCLTSIFFSFDIFTKTPPPRPPALYFFLEFASFVTWKSWLYSGWHFYVSAAFLFAENRIRPPSPSLPSFLFERNVRPTIAAHPKSKRNKKYEREKSLWNNTADTAASLNAPTNPLPSIKNIFSISKTDFLTR